MDETFSRCGYKIFRKLSWLDAFTRQGKEYHRRTAIGGDWPEEYDLSIIGANIAKLYNENPIR